MSVINQNLLLTPEGYQISRSVRLRSSASAYFNRTPAGAGSLTTWTFSTWLKRGSLSVLSELLNCYYATDNKTAYLRWNADNTLTYFDYNATSGTFTNQITTTQVFRDTSAWYHIVLAYDTTNATSSDRLRLYINGVRVTAFSTATYPSLNYTGTMNTASATTLGRYSASSTGYFDGYLTEVNFIDGQALTPSSFGETDAVTGVWKPKKYAGTYGTNGFYLNFSDNSAATAAAIGKDYSGNGNNWTPNNISVTAGVTYDSMLDVPTLWADGGNGRGNYAVASPVFVGNTTSASITNGNLTASSVNNSSWYYGIGTIFPTSGKWYTEITLSANTLAFAGIVRPAFRDTANIMGNNSDAYGYYSSNGQKYNGSATGTAYGSTWTTNDVIGVALDLDAGTLTFYKNGTTQGQAFSGISGEWTIAACTIHNAAAVGTVNLNFGQRPFAYTPPTGFKALNTQNLPDATIKKGSQYFDATTYTGNASTQTITNSGSMQPDLVWVKSRSNAYHGALVDSVRGVNKYSYSSLTAAEETQTTALSSFNSNGFSLNGSFGNVNANAATYVGWQWKESASAGFDIVTYTGNGSAQTLNHSLGVAPKMYIVKSRTDGGDAWVVYHASMPSASYYLTLNTTNAQASNSVVFNATAPTSSVFSVGSSRSTVSGNYVAYLFAEVAGYSKFGSYTGNGSADGPFVYLGFRPKFILIKYSSGVDNWAIFDTSRLGYNADNNELLANTSGAEGTADFIDILSNGFKNRNSDSRCNASGGTYIYAAFAENPFKNSLAR